MQNVRAWRCGCTWVWMSCLPSLFDVLGLPGLPHPRMTVRNFDRKLAIVFGLSFQCGNFPRPCQPEVNRVSRDSVPRPLEKKNVFFFLVARDFDPVVSLPGSGHRIAYALHLGNRSREGGPPYALSRKFRVCPEGGTDFAESPATLVPRGVSE